jgi:hypothetical protein
MQLSTYSTYNRIKYKNHNKLYQQLLHKSQENEKGVAECPPKERQGVKSSDLL